MAEAPRQRLFFALWPDGELQRHFYQLARRLQRHTRGKPIQADNIHLTLAFVGEVDADSQDCLELMASAIAVPGFSLSLDSLGFWARSHIVWAGCSESPPALLELVRRLQAGLASCALQADTRPYAPHLSLLRKAWRHPKMELEALEWTVGDFALVQSQTLPQGARYRILRRWPLLEPGGSAN